MHVCHLGLLKCKDTVITNAVTLLFARENDTIFTDKSAAVAE